MIKQEVQVWYILPSIRKAIFEVLKEQGMKQKHIAKQMNITEAAVSQYKNRKRAGIFEISKKMKDEIGRYFAKKYDAAKLDTKLEVWVEQEYKRWSND